MKKINVGIGSLGCTTALARVGRSGGLLCSLVLLFVCGKTISAAEEGSGVPFVPKKAAREKSIERAANASKRDIEERRVAVREAEKRLTSPRARRSSSLTNFASGRDDEEEASETAMSQGSSEGGRKKWDKTPPPVGKESQDKKGVEGQYDDAKEEGAEARRFHLFKKKKEKVTEVHITLGAPQDTLGASADGNSSSLVTPVLPVPNVPDQGKGDGNEFQGRTDLSPKLDEDKTPLGKTAGEEGNGGGLGGFVFSKVDHLPEGKNDGARPDDEKEDGKGGLPGSPKLDKKNGPDEDDKDKKEELINAGSSRFAQGIMGTVFAGLGYISATLAQEYGGLPGLGILAGGVGGPVILAQTGFIKKKPLDDTEKAAWYGFLLGASSSTGIALAKKLPTLSLPALRTPKLGLSEVSQELVPKFTL